jgi:hypothetical protein
MSRWVTAGAGVAEQDNWLAGVDPGAARDGGEGCGDAGDDVGVEVSQPLDPREPRLGDAPGAAAAGAVVDLGGQDLGQVGQVGLVFPDGGLGEPVGADGRQSQLAGGGADGGQGSGVGHGHRVLPDSSWS